LAMVLPGAGRGGFCRPSAVATSTLRACLLGLFCGLRSRPECLLAAAAPAQDSVPQAVEYIWPTALMNFPLASSDSDKGFLDSLASIGESGFKRYLEQILPKELAADPAFKQEYEEADGSRDVRAFMRWQKRVFSIRSRVPVEELNWDGKPVPKYPGVSYDWKELYEDPNFKSLNKKLEAIGHIYMKQLHEQYQKEKNRIFTWVEPYRQGDFMRPHEHTGAMTAGMFFARYHEDEQREGQKLVFQDPRGHFAPFGRRHEHTPIEGEAMLWPSWSAHYLEPQMANRTNIYFGFLIWPPGGAVDLDWEDDATGDIVHRKTTAVRRAPPAQADAPTPQRSEL